MGLKCHRALLGGKTTCRGDSPPLLFHHLGFVSEDKKAMEGMEGWPYTARGFDMIQCCG